MRLMLYWPVLRMRSRLFWIIRHIWVRGRVRCESVSVGWDKRGSDVLGFWGCSFKLPYDSETCYVETIVQMCFMWMLHVKLAGYSSLCCFSKIRGNHCLEVKASMECENNRQISK